MTGIIYIPGVGYANNKTLGDLTKILLVSLNLSFWKLHFICYIAKKKAFLISKERVKGNPDSSEKH